jgi:hypothetical protein
LGDFNEPFEIEEVGTILVQVKNRKKSSTISTTLRESFEPPHSNHIRPRYQQRNWDPILSTNPDTKILFILFDFGIEPSSSVEISPSYAKRPTVFHYFEE